MNCRHCSAPLHLPFLDLGSAPFSNNYISSSSLQTPEQWFPLRVMVCDQCWLVQTEDFAEADNLFSADYAYFSSFSTTWLNHARKYVKKMVGLLSLNPSSMVVEIAANDGYLLQYIQEAQIPCLGVEPTTSTASAARNKGITIIEEFFGKKLAEKLAEDGYTADLMVANNVLAHVPLINDFVQGFSTLLKPQGVATFEFPHLLRLVEGRQFDTIYHEHYSYLSLTTIKQIFSYNGLTVFDVEELPTHGGSLRVYAQRADHGPHQISPNIHRILSAESSAGIKANSFYTRAQQDMEFVKDELLRYLLKAKQDGLHVAAYGAAAKGNTLLNFAGIRSDLVSFVVDRNPAKQGKFMPGSRIPIVEEAHLEETRPDRILILPWNIKDEISNQLKYVRKWRGQFVTAIPKLEIF